MHWTKFLLLFENSFIIFSDFAAAIKLVAFSNQTAGHYLRLIRHLRLVKNPSAVKSQTKSKCTVFTEKQTKRQMQHLKHIKRFSLSDFISQSNIQKLERKRFLSTNFGIYIKSVYWN